MTDAGAYQERIRIERKDQTRSASGGFVEGAPTLIATCWARTAAKGSRELERMRQAVSETDLLFAFRGPLSVNPSMQVAHGGRTFEIVGIETTDGRPPQVTRGEVLLTCVLRAGSGPA
jgi:head-tail adaptor